MNINKIKENFLVLENPPSTEDFKRHGYHSATPIFISDKIYWVIFRNKHESILYEYLQAPNDYKVKENLFGIVINKGYAYTTKKGVPDYLQLVPSDKWEIKDKNIKRELDIVISNKDQSNDQLLHYLYTKTREKK